MRTATKMIVFDPTYSAVTTLIPGRHGVFAEAKLLLCGTVYYTTRLRVDNDSSVFRSSLSCKGMILAGCSASD